MKKNSALLLAAVLVMSSFLAGCVIKINDEDTSLVLSDNNGSLDSLPGTVTAPQGSTFSINLESNYTTGYTWSAVIEDETIIELVSNEYTPEETGEVGSGGVATLTFSALKEGETDITLTYAQDWEGGDIDKTRTLTIHVE